MDGINFGYARVSTKDQSYEIQRDALLAAGVPANRIFCEKATGTSMQDRSELRNLLACLRKGDTLIVMRLDRLMRNMKDYVTIVEELRSKGVGLRCTHEPIDATGPMGMLVMDILASVAAFETQRRRERQLEGIARAKKEGRYKGGKPRVNSNYIRELHAAGVGPSEIARKVGCGRASVYRIISPTTQPQEAAA